MTMMSDPRCRLRHAVRSRLSGYPALYLPLARRKYGHLDHRVVGAKTELVIEGFERSGNTFAAIAFEVAQPTRVRTVHHLHAAAQIVWAARNAIPALVLIREPIATVASTTIFERCLPPADVLAAWIRFYRRVVPHRARIVVADFPDVTSDFGAVIGRVNDRFGTTFGVFAHTSENQQRVFDLIDERQRTTGHGLPTRETLPRPNAERAEQNRAIRAQLERPALDRLRGQAISLYRSLVPDVA